MSSKSRNFKYLMEETKSEIEKLHLKPRNYNTIHVTIKGGKLDHGASPFCVLLLP